ERGRLIRSGRAAARVALVWLAATVTLLVLDDLMAGFALDSRWLALLIALCLGLLYALVWPLIMRIALGFTVITLGLGGLLLSGLLVLGVFLAVPGAQIRGLPTAILIAVWLTVSTAFVSSLLSIDEDELFFRRVARRVRRRGVWASDAGTPGVIYLQIDGLGYDVLRRALRDGNVPNLARWVRSGSHRVSVWHTDWSSQTGASVLGIMHGANTGVLGFRYYDKPAGRLVAVSRPSDAADLERRHSDGRGLLSDGGAAHGNLFTGDAAHVSFTMSAPIRRKGRLGAGYYAYFANPVNAGRTAAMYVLEVGRELVAAARQRRSDVWPRVDRGGIYPLIRPATTVISRDVITAAISEDMIAGRPAVYADFLGYDEVGHHSGIERYDVLEVLRSIDQQIGRLARVSQLAPRPYHFVILSDHGLTQGPSFTDRFGYTFDSFVRAAADSSPHTQPEPGDGKGTKIARRRNEHSSSPQVCAAGGQQQIFDEDITIVYSGHLATIALMKIDGRATAEDIDLLYPHLLTRLRDHPGVGFLLVASRTDGGMVLGRSGSLRLDTGEVTGADPLAGYGPHAREQVARTHDFDNCADIIVNSAYDPETDEASAFEMHVASHGALGGPQSHGFLLYPCEFSPPPDPIVGAVALHQVLRRWRADLVESGVEAVPAPVLAEAGRVPSMDA
ncbi:MAG: phage holin family protein, partial [Geodermatophilaceae bacterium]|nr:phage holin family protein [Geodermatophilaceae bacterium]